MTGLWDEHSVNVWLVFCLKHYFVCNNFLKKKIYWINKSGTVWFCVWFRWLKSVTKNVNMVNKI